MQLGAGQTVRQSFTLEVGTLAETVTVAGEAPLIETAASLQSDSLGSQEVTRTAGQPPQPHQPDEPDRRRERERRRHGADERRRGRRHGHHCGRHRSELESRGAVAFAVRRPEPDLGHEPRLDLRSADRQGRAARRIRRRRRRPDQRDQPLGHERVPWLGVLQRSEREMERAQLLLDGGAARRHVQPVRRHARRSGDAEQGVLLRDL